MAVMHDFISEVKALHTVLTPESEWSSKLWSELTPELFHNPACKIVYSRISDMVKLLGQDSQDSLPSMDFVLSDSEIPDSARASFLEAVSTCPVIKTKADLRVLTNTLHSKASIRSVARASQNAIKDIQDSVKPEDDLDSIKKALEKELARTNDNLFGDNYISIGADYNQVAEDTYWEIRSGKAAQNLIRSGFEEFDTISGGFERTNLVLISATSGGGKSTLALNLLIRQYLMGYNVVLVSFEMSYKEIMDRVLSIISEIEMGKIKNNRLSPDEKIRLDTAWREFILRGAEKNCTFSILYSTSAKLSDIKSWIHRKGLKPDSLVIDYLNFLSSSESKDAQWQQLIDIAGDCKRLAGQLNCVLFLLAQLDEDYNLKYAKGIKDHANFHWGWVRDEKSKSDRLILVKQMKARNAAVYDFTLVERFDICQFRGLNEEDRKDWPDLNQLLDLYDLRKLIRMSTTMIEAEVIDGKEVITITLDKEVYDKLEIKSSKKPLQLPSQYEDVD